MGPNQSGNLDASESDLMLTPSDPMLAPSDITLTERTVRDIVHTSVGGSGLRLRLSNAFGTNTIKLGPVFVGMRATGATVKPGTNRQVTFGGSGDPSVLLPPGGEVLSDPLPGDRDRSRHRHVDQLCVDCG
jgi:hypothetical protein